jgi:hypothetical protein
MCVYIWILLLLYTHPCDHSYILYICECLHLENKIECCWKIGGGREGVKERNGRVWTDQNKYTHGEHALRCPFEHQLKY